MTPPTLNTVIPSLITHNNAVNMLDPRRIIGYINMNSHHIRAIKMRLSFVNLFIIKN